MGYLPQPERGQNMYRVHKDIIFLPYGMEEVSLSLQSTDIQSTHMCPNFVCVASFFFGSNPGGNFIHENDRLEEKQLRAKARESG